MNSVRENNVNNEQIPVAQRVKALDITLNMPGLKFRQYLTTAWKSNCKRGLTAMLTATSESEEYIIRRWRNTNARASTKWNHLKTLLELKKESPYPWDWGKIYYLTRFLPKTAYKWTKLNREGGQVPSGHLGSAYGVFAKYSRNH